MGRGRGALVVSPTVSSHSGAKAISTEKAISPTVISKVVGGDTRGYVAKTVVRGGDSFIDKARTPSFSRS